MTLGGRSMIRSAVLLAAGRAKRQRPYTDTVPKPLLPVHGRATLYFVLTATKRAGVERVCIVTNHLAEKISAFVEDGSKWNLDVTFAHQIELIWEYLSKIEPSPRGEINFSLLCKR